MLGMKIIPSVFVEEIQNIDLSQIVGHFNFFQDDLPIPEAFEAELLQWKVILFTKWYWNATFYLKISINMWSFNHKLFL